MPRVVHFEIHASQPERAIQFYQKLLGWQFTKWEGPAEYWLIKTGSEATPGIDGGLLRRQGDPPADAASVNAFVCTVDVPSIDATLTQLPACGGRVALPKRAIPGVGWLAYGKDTEGNILGFLQNDPLAA